MARGPNGSRLRPLRPADAERWPKAAALRKSTIRRARPVQPDDEVQLICGADVRHKMRKPKYERED